MADEPITFQDQQARYYGYVDTVHPWDKPFAPGRNSDHETGVSFTAPWEGAYAGFPEHARRCARALAAAGMPVHLRSINPNMQWEMGPGGEEVRRQVAHLLDTSIAQYVAQIDMLVPNLDALATLTTHPFMTKEQVASVNSRRIVYTVWERQTIEPAYVELLNRVGQCWVATRDSAAVLARAGVEDGKIKIVPCPYDDDEPLLKLRGRTRLPGPPRFYHIGKWEPRKAQDNIIIAFLNAFAPGEAILMVKTSQGAPRKLETYPASPGEAIGEALKLAGVQARGWTAENVDCGVKVMRQAFTLKQMEKLHATGDVYVTLSRGEGWDMPAFDAKLAGNRMVYVASGGPQEFAGEDDKLVPCCGTVPCHPIYGWDGCSYLNYRVEDAVLAMQAAAMAVRNRAPTIGSSFKRFSMAEVGKVMRQYVDGLTSLPK